MRKVREVKSMWLPLSRRESIGNHDDFVGPFEGVQPWMDQPLKAWCFEVLRIKSANGNLSDYLMNLQMHGRRSFQIGRNVEECYKFLMFEFSQASNDFLNLVDQIVAGLSVSNYSEQRLLIKLEQILTASGSIYTVALPSGINPLLNRRVTLEFQESFQKIVSNQSIASEHLQVAWSMFYGRQPDNSKSYAESIKAIEAALQPIVLPNDSLATIGKIRAALIAKPEKWEFAIGNVKDFASNLTGLFESQGDRHGSGLSRTINDNASTSAVLSLAVYVVTLVENGGIVGVAAPG